MPYQYTYISKFFSSKREAESLYSRLSPFASVVIQPLASGFVVTCGLGDEDELAMLEYEEQNLRREN